MEVFQPNKEVDGRSHGSCQGRFLVMWEWHYSFHLIVVFLLEHVGAKIENPESVAFFFSWNHSHH